MPSKGEVTKIDEKKATKMKNKEKRGREEGGAKKEYPREST